MSLYSISKFTTMSEFKTKGSKREARPAGFTIEFKNRTMHSRNGSFNVRIAERRERKPRYVVNQIAERLGTLFYSTLGNHRRFLFLASESFSRVRSLEFGSDSSRGSMYG